MNNKYLEKVAQILDEQEKAASVGSKAFKELKTVASLSDNPFLSRAAQNVKKKYGRTSLKGVRNPHLTLTSRNA